MNSNVGFQGAAEPGSSADFEPREERKRAVTIMARSLARDLLAQGYDIPLLVTLASELIALATAEVRIRCARLPEVP